MRVLVTGAAGFVGRHLMARLIKKGYLCFGVDIAAERGDANIVRMGVNDFTRSDYRAQSTWDVVVHLAANIVGLDQRLKAGVLAYEDVVLDYGVLRWLHHIQPKQVVILSSCAVDGTDDPYSAVKRNLEAMALALNRSVRTTILRPFSGYGHDQTAEYPFGAILRRALLREDPLTVWGGHQTRDWLYIEDLVDAICWAIEGKFPAGVPLDIGTGVGTTMLRTAEVIARAVGYAPKIEGDRSKPVSSVSRVAATGEARKYGWEAQTSFQDGVREALYLRGLVPVEKGG